MSEPVHSVHVTQPAFGLIRVWSPLVGGAWFYTNQASQSERQRLAITILPAVSGTPSSAFKEDTRISNELQALGLRFVRYNKREVSHVRLRVSM